MSFGELSKNLTDDKLSCEFSGNADAQLLVDFLFENAIKIFKIEWIVNDPQFEMYSPEYVLTKFLGQLLAHPNVTFSSLKKFTLVHTEFDERSSQLLADLIRTLPHIREIRIINAESFGDHAKPVYEAMQATKNLRNVTLKNCGLQLKDAHSIFIDYLPFKDSIDLSCNDFSDGTFPLNLSGFETAHTIKTLSLNSCGLDENNLAVIGVALTTNNTLTYMDLSHNSLTPYAIDSIRTSIQYNWSLRKLDMFCMFKNMELDKEVQILREHNPHIAISY